MKNATHPFCRRYGEPSVAFLFPGGALREQYAPAGIPSHGRAIAKPFSRSRGRCESLRRRRPRKEHNDTPAGTSVREEEKNQQRPVRFFLFILQWAQCHPKHRGVGTTQVEACDRSSAASDHVERIYVCVCVCLLTFFCRSVFL